MKEITKLELALKAAALILAGVEPLRNENVRDFVKRGEKELRNILEEELYLEQ